MTTRDQQYASVARVRCNICGQFFLDAGSAQTHLWTEHRGFMPKPLGVSVRKAIAAGLKKGFTQD